MIGTAYFIPRKQAVSPTFNVCSQASSRISPRRVGRHRGGIAKALLCRKSSRPKRSRARLIAASSSAGLVTSVRTAIALPPAAVSSAATLCAACSLNSAITTAPPRCANPIAVARPIPDPPPVTTAVLPSNRILQPPEIDLMEPARKCLRLYHSRFGRPELIDDPHYQFLGFLQVITKSLRIGINDFHPQIRKIVFQDLRNLLRFFRRQLDPYHKPPSMELWSDRCRAVSSGSFHNTDIDPRSPQKQTAPDGCKRLIHSSQGVLVDRFGNRKRFNSNAARPKLQRSHDHALTVLSPSFVR